LKTIIVSTALFFGSVFGIHKTEVLVTEETVKVTTVVGSGQSFIERSAERRAEEVQNAKNQASLLILKDSYKYDEVSDKVRVLQGVLANVRVDGHYGAITLRRHVEALQARGLPTTNVPQGAARGGVAEYNISSDPEHRCPMWEDKIREHGLEPVEVFSYIAYRESRCNPKAVNARWDANGNVIWTLNKNKSIDRGLVQINSSWQTVTSQVCNVPKGQMDVLFDVDCNLSVAKFIMDNSAGKLGNWRVFKD
jgi:hypothetical protein